MLVGNDSSKYQKMRLPRKEVARDTSTSEAEKQTKRKNRQKKLKKHAYAVSEVQSSLKELRSSLSDVHEEMRRSCVSALRWMSTLVRCCCFQCSTGAQNAFASFAGSHETVLARSSC